MFRSLVRFGALTVALLATEQTAHASGFLSDQFGNDEGQPGLANTYSVYFNPGAMAGTHGTEITLDGTFAARSLDYNRSAYALSSASSGPQYPGGAAYTDSNTGQAHLFNVLAAPFIGFVTDFGGSNFRLGVASYIPFGGEVSWGKNQAFANSSVDPGAYDGPQRWSSISNSTSSLYETAALAYRFEKARLGIGVSASVIRSGVTDTRARNADGSDDIVTNSGALEEGRSYLDVSGIEVGAAAGLYWEATEDRKLRFGVSYTSQPNFGTMRLNGTFKFTPGTLGTPLSESVDLLQAYPDVIRFGGAWRVSPQTEVRLDGDWQRWSRFKNQCVVPAGAPCPVDSNGAALQTATGVLEDLPRDWKDTVKLRLGIAYWITPAAEVHASASWSSPPVGASHQDPLLFDSTEIAGTVGIRYGFTRHLYGSLAYTYTYLVPVTVYDSAYPTYQFASHSPSTDGSYSSSLYILDAAVSYRF